MTENIQISVVVCTYNRSDLLAQVLETLCTQSAALSTYEVIVVDNNSRDDTAAVTARFAAKYPNVRYYFESNPGLSQARNRGWQEAHGQYVAYVDDDCKVPPQWITTAQEIINMVKPTIFGGPYFAFYATPKPVWFKDVYASSVISNVARPLQDNEFLSGGNMVFECQVLASSGAFRSDLGMKGDTLAYGEETALIIHIRKTIGNTVVYYDPRLYVFHLVRPEKMQWLQILRGSFARGRYTYRTFDKPGDEKGRWGMIILKALAYFFYFFFDALFIVWLRKRTQYPYMQNYWYEHSLIYLSKLGEIYAKIQHQEVDPK